MEEISKIDPKKFKVDPVKGGEILAKYKPVIDEMEALGTDYNAIMSEEITDETVKKAKALKKKYVSVRTSSAKKIKELKAEPDAIIEFLKAIEKAQITISNKAEAALDEIETKQKELIKNAPPGLKEIREQLVKEVTNEPILMDLSVLPEPIFNAYLAGLKFQPKKEAPAPTVAAEEKESKLATNPSPAPLTAKKESVVVERSPAQINFDSVQKLRLGQMQTVLIPGELLDLTKLGSLSLAEYEAIYNGQRKKFATYSEQRTAEMQELEALRKSSIPAKIKTEGTDTQRLKDWVNSFIFPELDTTGMQKNSIEIATSIRRKYEEPMKDWALQVAATAK